MFSLWIRRGRHIPIQFPSPIFPQSIVSRDVGHATNGARIKGSRKKKKEKWMETEKHTDVSRYLA